MGLTERLEYRKGLKHKALASARRKSVISTKTEFYQESDPHPLKIWS